MDVSFSDTVLDRLPSAIRELDLIHQKVYVYVRLRKRDEEISKLLKLSLEDARSKIKSVRDVLIRSGQLDLIEEPSFVSIHSHDDDSAEFQLPSRGLPVEERLIIKEFLSVLKETVDKLPHAQARILRLRYTNQMSAREIVDFSKGIGLSLIPGKALSDINEQDIFYLLNTSLKAVLIGVKESYGGALAMDIENLKYIFEEAEV